MAAQAVEIAPAKLTLPGAGHEGIGSVSKQTLEQRFWAKVDRGSDYECWEWQGSRSRGYGRVSKPGGGSFGAHRLAYELLVGPIPEGLTIDHLCRNRACVNPAHLEAVTNRENVLRGVGPTAQKARKTHCIRGHEFTPENTYVPPHRPRERECRKCKALLDKKRWGKPAALSPPTEKAGSE